MQGTFRTGSKRIKRMVLRLEGSNVTVTDVMLQPGRNPSGWLPHVTELPWIAGVISGGSNMDQDVIERFEQLESLTLMQAALLQSLGVKVEDLEQGGGGIDQQAIYDAYVETRNG
jgi:hypothetical protein